MVISAAARVIGAIDLLEAGFHVVREKPLTASVEQAETVAAAVVRPVDTCC